MISSNCFGAAAGAAVVIVRTGAEPTGDCDRFEIHFIQPLGRECLGEYFIIFHLVSTLYLLPDIYREFRYLRLVIKIQYNKSIKTQIISAFFITLVSGHSKKGSMPMGYRKIVISAVAFAALLGVFSSTPVSYLVNTGYAESGVGKDVFKVVVSMFGVTKETGGVVGIVTADGNSRVRSFDVSAIKLPSANDSSTSNDNVLEFVAAFPTVVVNSGDPYRACVLTLNDMHQYCKEGHNSPAKRPEFVDISMDKHIKILDSGKQSKSKDVLPQTN